MRDSKEDKKAEELKKERGNLNKKILIAKQRENQVVVASSKEEVNEGTEFVSKTYKAEYKNAIKKAEDICKNLNLSKAELKKAADDLNEASKKFNRVKKMGTKKIIK